ncbi:MAG TPA: hypothetical protein VGP93_16400, partial [Polyangiaceae bacterium]|nr:hypothetical protein [Polyangiaceae bacterium]
MRNSRPPFQLGRGVLSAALLLAVSAQAQQPGPSARPAASQPSVAPAVSVSGRVAPSASPAAPSASSEVPPLASAEVPVEAPPAPSGSVPALEEPKPELVSAPPLAPAPPSSAPRIERSDPASVTIHDNVVFSLYAPRGQKPPGERARLASKALSGLGETAKGDDVRVTRQGDAAVVFVGQTPIVQLTELDAELAGDSNLDIHAANIAAALRRAVETERKRSAVAKSVFSISLVVFFALIAFYLMRKVGEFAEKARAWLDEHGENKLAV